MKVRFGYVAIALNLIDASTSKTITLSNLQKLDGTGSQAARLRRIAGENLENTQRVLRYNIGEQIYVYRLTSKLIPFATYPLNFEWDYRTDFAQEFEHIGRLIKEFGLRVSAHPDHYTVVNSPDEKVFQDSVKDLEYHDNIFSAMGLDEKYKLVLHLGGFYGNKRESIRRFMKNFERLPDKVQARIVLENDDKIYTAEEVLSVCKQLEIPMVLDIHHHQCNPGGMLNQLVPNIWDLWNCQPPKIHVSSPKDAKSFRHHADFIEPSSLAEFFKIVGPLGKDFDVMVEAKRKDQAMLKLVDDLSSLPGITRTGNATIQVALKL